MKAYQASKFPRSCALHSFLFFSLPPLSLFAITRLRSANKSGPVSIYNLTVSSPFSSFSLSLWHTHATDHGPPLRPARIPANLCNYRAAARPISSMALGARRRTNTRAREEERRTSYRSYVHHWPAQHPPTTLSLQWKILPVHESGLGAILFLFFFFWNGKEIFLNSKEKVIRGGIIWEGGRVIKRVSGSWRRKVYTWGTICL